MNELAIPEPRELEAYSPAERWALEEQLDGARDALREYNDEELRRWVEEEGKTQVEIAALVGRSQARISQRCSKLGLVSGSNRGRPRNISTDNSDDEVLEGEVIPPKRRKRESPYADDDGRPSHYLADMDAEDAFENVRTQALHWFEQGRVVKDLLDERKSLEPRSEEDRKALNREAAVMERTARRIKEATSG